MGILVDKIQIVKGATEPFDFTFKDDNGDPISLADKNVRLMVKENIGDPDNKALLNKLILIADHIDPYGGVTYLKLTTTETNALKIGQFFCEIRLESTANEEFPSEIFEFYVNDGLKKG